MCWHASPCGTRRSENMPTWITLVRTVRLTRNSRGTNSALPAPVGAAITRDGDFRRSGRQAIRSYIAVECVTESGSLVRHLERGRRKDAGETTRDSCVCTFDTRSEVIQLFSLNDSISPERVAAPSEWVVLVSVIWRLRRISDASGNLPVNQRIIGRISCHWSRHPVHDRTPHVTPPAVSACWAAFLRNIAPCDTGVISTATAGESTSTLLRRHPLFSCQKKECGALI